MKTYKFTYFNLDKPNRNGHLYTKECIDNAIIEDREYPLYLENTYDMPTQIPIGKVTIKNNYPEIEGTVTLNGSYTPDFYNEYVCSAGTCSCQLDFENDFETIKDFNLDHFFLSDTCSFKYGVCFENEDNNK